MVAYCNSLPHFFLSTMHEVVSEAILLNTFFPKQLTSSSAIT